VTFSGGYVLPGGTVGTGMTALPQDLEHACLEQCAAWYLNRNRPGAGSVSGEGGSMSVAQHGSAIKPLDLLPMVRRTLEQYERWVM
jgi:hypothetical protein